MASLEDGFMFDDDGNLVGQVHEADDGNLLLVADDGSIIAAATPAGVEVDASHYSIAQDDGHGEMAERIAALEAQLAPPQQQAPEPEIDPEQIRQEVESNLEMIARDYGRALTSKEVDTIFREMGAQLEAGREMDFDMAAMRAGLTHADNFTRQQRVEWATQRVQDNELAANGEQPLREHYDLSDTAQRHEFMNARLEGRIDDEQAASLTGEQPAVEAAEPTAQEAA